MTALVIEGVVLEYGRPGSRRLKVVTFKADPELVETVDRLARMRGSTRSEIIREAIEDYIRRNLSSP